MILAKYAHPNNGYKHQQEEINGLLKVNEQYEVDNVTIKYCHTDIHLRGIATPFNSVFFDFYEDGKEIDIYTDRRFNPHIKEYCNVEKEKG